LYFIFFAVSVIIYFTRIWLFNAEKSLAEIMHTAVCQPTNTEYLTSFQFKSNIIKSSFFSEILNFKYYRVIICTLRIITVVFISLRKFASHHQSFDLIIIKIIDIVCANDRAVPHDSYGIAVLKYFIQLMCYKYSRHQEGLRACNACNSSP